MGEIGSSGSDLLREGLLRVVNEYDREKSIRFGGGPQLTTPTSPPCLIRRKRIAPKFDAVHAQMPAGDVPPPSTRSASAGGSPEVGGPHPAGDRPRSFLRPSAIAHHR
jgi:hypothetical protein